MKKAFFLCIFLASSFAQAEDSTNVNCNTQDRAIQMTSTALAKKDLRTFFLKRLSELGIKIQEDSLEINLTQTNDPIVKLISAAVLTQAGSILSIQTMSYDSTFAGFSLRVGVNNVISRNNEGRPISHICTVYNDLDSFYDYYIINLSYDNYVIDRSDSKNIFTSTQEYKIPVY